MSIKKWINNNCKRLDNKTVLITGSTSDLASYFTEFLLEFGANLIFANRNLDKSEKQKEKLLKKFPNAKIKILQLDLFDINIVKKFTNEIKNYNVDYYIFNSAMFNEKRETSNCGFDNVFQVNFVSPYYIIKQLMPLNENSKIIVIGSIAHNFTKVDFNDIQMLKIKNPNKIYGNSKRFLMYSLTKLFENSPKNLTIVHPGITLTRMTSHYPKSINWLVKLNERIIFQKPKKASLSVLLGIFNNTQTNEWIGPKINNIWGYPKVQKLKNYSDEEATQIFNIAEEIYNKIK